MKRISVLICSLLLSVFMISTLEASSCRQYIGNYENDHVKFEAKHRILTYFRRRGPLRGFRRSSTLIFKIAAKEGFKILNLTSVKANGKVEKFKGQNIVNKYYKKGKIAFRGSFTDGSKIKLTYFICKDSDDTCQRVVKTFKTVITRRIYRSHGRVKIKLVEIE